MTALYPCLRALWKVELKSDNLGHLEEYLRISWVSGGNFQAAKCSGCDLAASNNLRSDVGTNE